MKLLRCVAGLLVVIQLASGLAQDTKAVADKIRSSQRDLTPEQQQAFQFVAENYAKDPQATPAELQEALKQYLKTITKSEVRQRPRSLDPETLPIWVAVLFTKPDGKTHSAAALRSDFPLASRLKAVEKLKAAKSTDMLTSVGRTLMTRPDQYDRYIAATAFTSMEAYPPDAAKFLVDELTTDTPSRVPVILQNDDQAKKLYRNSDANGKAKVAQYAHSKGLNLKLEQ